MTDGKTPPWEWSEEHWRKIVGIARGGRSLAPKTWPGGARCAVTLSFDADHEMIPLRDSDESPMRGADQVVGARRKIVTMHQCIGRAAHLRPQRIQLLRLSVRSQLAVFRLPYPLQRLSQTVAV